jgi:hypothetical protein
MGLAVWIAAAGKASSNEISVPLISDHPTPDLHSRIRNPSMGWVLYVEGTPPAADAYWRSVARYVNTASILYFRVPWAYLEPKQGQYAWNNDPNFQALIRGARERGLQIAFRVVANAEDSSYPGAPDYVRTAGAAGFRENDTTEKRWNPSLVDPVFRNAFSKFIDAFGKKFDDPNDVAFVDGGGIGWWGEMHHLHLDPKEHAETYQWLSSTYAQAFRHVLLGIQVHSELSDWGRTDALALNKYGYVARIDGLGSFWFDQDSRNELDEISAKIPFYGESCYFSLRQWSNWKNGKEGYQNPREVLEATMKDALAYHANTLDLREPNDSATWFEVAPDLVQRFLERGGYRLAPTTLTVEPSTGDGTKRTLVVHQTWRNFGVGFLPNDNQRWNEKYRVAFALLPMHEETPAEIAVDTHDDPASWKGGTATDETSSLNFHASPGAYRLAMAIVDTTRNDQPAITLAIQNETDRPAWHVLGEITIP